jgi:hypothetical protein
LCLPPHSEGATIRDDFGLILAPVGISEFAPLQSYLESKGHFTEKDLGFLARLFIPVTLRTGEFLQRAGEPVQYAAFVAKAAFAATSSTRAGRRSPSNSCPKTGGLGIAHFS